MIVHCFLVYVTTQYILNLCPFPPPTPFFCLTTSTPPPLHVSSFSSDHNDGPICVDGCWVCMCVLARYTEAEGLTASCPPTVQPNSQGVKVKKKKQTNKKSRILHSMCKTTLNAGVRQGIGFIQPDLSSWGGGSTLKTSE